MLFPRYTQPGQGELCCSPLTHAGAHAVAFCVGLGSLSSRPVLFLYFNVLARFLIARPCRPPEIKGESFSLFQDLKSLHKTTVTPFLVVMGRPLREPNAQGVFFSENFK